MSWVDKVGRMRSSRLDAMRPTGFMLKVTVSFETVRHLYRRITRFLRG